MQQSSADPRLISSSPTSPAHYKDLEDSSIEEHETADSESDRNRTNSEAVSSASELRDYSDSEASNPPDISTAHELDYNSSTDDSDDAELLFSGSDKTADEAVLEVCKLFLKHRWSKASLGDTLKVMASTLPQPNNMPHSLATLKKYLNLSALPCSKIPYYYCSSCLQLKESKLIVTNVIPVFQVFSFTSVLLIR